MIAIPGTHPSRPLYIRLLKAASDADKVTCLSSSQQGMISGKCLRYDRLDRCHRSIGVFTLVPGDHCEACGHATRSHFEDGGCFNPKGRSRGPNICPCGKTVAEAKYSLVIKPPKASHGA